MNNFTAHQLRFTCEVQTPILLNEHQGSAIRGALFHALRHQFCYEKQLQSCAQCALWATCPICFLVATRHAQSQRGAEVPRPYTIEPPLHASRITPGGTHYDPGETISFGLTIFARALNLFPYVVIGSQTLQQGGLGKRQRTKDGRWQRGTFTVQEIAAVNRLSGEQQAVLRQGETMVTVPNLPVTHEQVLAWAAQLPRDRLTLLFKTPTRITEGGKLLHRPAFRPLIQRLHQRLRDLTRYFTDTPWEFDFRQVLAQAAAVQVVEDHTRWVDLESYSTRLNKSTPRGGFVGDVTFAGDLQPFLPWLVWGEITHVGKDAVKGNGWYRISE